MSFPRMEKKVFHNIEKIQQNPTALIVGAEKFIELSLKKALDFYGCQVILGKEKLETGDYIFCFSQNWPRLKEILGFAKQNTKILFALRLTPELNVLETKISQQAKESKLDIRIVRYFMVYGPGMDKTDFQNLAKTAKPIGPQPIFISDFIYGIFKAMFTGGTKGKSFSLIDEDDKLGWQPKVDFKEGIEQTKRWLEKKSAGGEASLKVAMKDEVESIAKARSRFSLLIPTLLLIIILLFYPFASLVFFGFFGAWNLSQAQAAILKGNLSRAGKHADWAQNSFENGKGKMEQLSSILNFFSLQKTEQLGRQFWVGETTAGGVVSFVKAADNTKQLLKAVFQKQPGDINRLIGEIKLELEKSFNQLSLAESQLGSDEKTEKLAKVRNLILQAREGLEILPEAIGLAKKKTYLVLFQNNAELRPTGGFIGSFGILTFDEGQLVDFEVKDVYSADGQLKGHVEPPPDLKKYLGEAGWYLRDSNWDPDFPASAARAAWFLEKETGRVVDGVVGMNLFLVQQILEVVGEAKIPDYQENINAANFFERAEYYSQISFFPGSTQKQDFLGSAAGVLFEKISQGDEKIWFGLARHLYPLLQSKDLMVWLNDPQAMKVVTGLGWEGGIKSQKSKVKSQKSIEDYLMVVEANVGINKANYFLKRSFSHQIKIKDDGVVEETLRLDYQNTSQSEAFPAGRYKSYMRVYTPLKTELIKVVIKNPLTGESEELGSERREIKEDHGKQVFGFLVEVPIQENRSVEVVYRLAEKFTLQTTQYLLLLQKQSGIRDEAFNLWFTPPAGTVAFPRNSQANQITEGFVFSPKFDKDLLFEIDLVR